MNGRQRRFLMPTFLTPTAGLAVTPPVGGVFADRFGFGWYRCGRRTALSMPVPGFTGTVNAVAAW